MGTLKTEYWGYPLEVDYDYTAGGKGGKDTPPTPEEIDILDWRFESEDALEELNLYNERACAIFEDELREMIAAHEARQKKAQKWIKPYKAAQRRRMYNR